MLFVFPSILDFDFFVPVLFLRFEQHQLRPHGFGDFFEPLFLRFLLVSLPSSGCIRWRFFTISLPLICVNSIQSVKEIMNDRPRLFNFLTKGHQFLHPLGEKLHCYDLTRLFHYVKYDINR